jgi:hypothetical protein
MALVALVALLVAVPLFNLGGAEAEAEPQAVPPTSTPLPKGAPSTGRASITFTSLRPFTIAGRGFKAAERVSVRVFGEGSKRVVASRRGAFVVRFPYQGNCPSLSIVAVGSKGSRASLNISHLLCVEP